MKCERCQVEAVGFDLHDYCAKCSKNLCAKCMANGCCRSKPAKSGQQLDGEERAEHQADVEEKDAKRYES